MRNGGPGPAITAPPIAWGMIEAISIIEPHRTRITTAGQGPPYMEFMQ